MPGGAPPRIPNYKGKCSEFGATVPEPSCVDGVLPTEGILLHSFAGGIGEHGEEIAVKMRTSSDSHAEPVILISMTGNLFLAV